MNAWETMAEEDDQDFMGYAGRNGGKAMLDDMELEKNLDMMVEPSEEEKEYERRLKEKAERDKEKEKEKEKKKEKKSKDKKDKKDKDKKKSKVCILQCAVSYRICFMLLLLLRKMHRDARSNQAAATTLFFL